MKDAEKIFSEHERSELADFLAANPESGDVIPGGNGVRKLRWGAKGRGKRGGARVIYYFSDRNMPVFLLAVYAKGEKVDLTAAERKNLGKLVDELLQQYRWH